MRPKRPLSAKNVANSVKKTEKEAVSRPLTAKLPILSTLVMSDREIDQKMTEIHRFDVFSAYFKPFLGLFLARNGPGAGEFPPVSAAIAG